MRVYRSPDLLKPTKFGSPDNYRSSELPGGFVTQIANLLSVWPARNPGRLGQMPGCPAEIPRGLWLFGELVTRRSPVLHPKMGAASADAVLCSRPIGAPSTDFRKWGLLVCTRLLNQLLERRTFGTASDAFSSFASKPCPSRLLNMPVAGLISFATIPYQLASEAHFAVVIGQPHRERSLHTGEVQGSIPCAPTTKTPVIPVLFEFASMCLFGKYRHEKAELSGNKRGNLGEFVLPAF